MPAGKPSRVITFSYSDFRDTKGTKGRRDEGSTKKRCGGEHCWRVLLRVLLRPFASFVFSVRHLRLAKHERLTVLAISRSSSASIGCRVVRRQQPLAFRP